jgi:tripartite-type tricarboxylate transporter receptor subunit TctC
MNTPVHASVALGLAALLAQPAEALAQAWPARPVKVVSVAPPGGAIDLLARIVAEDSSRTFNQPFVVENRPGANGNIAVQAVLREPAEGYHFFVGPPGPFSINQSIMSKMPFDPAKDIAPVAMLGVAPLVLVAHPSVPATNLKELLAWMKGRAGKVTYASQGVAGTGHLAMELFLAATGMTATHIPYTNSGAAATADQIAGRIDIAFTNTSTTLGYINQGQLRAIGVAELKRIGAAPQVPTIAEQGLPGFEATPWLALATRTGVPHEIIQRMNETATRGVAKPENLARIHKIGNELRPMSVDELTTFIRAESVKWADIVKRSGAKID